MTAGPTLARAIDLSKGLGTGGEVSPGQKYTRVGPAL